MSSENPPTFAIVVCFKIKSSFVDSFRQRVLQQASDSLKQEADCHQFDVLVDPTDSSTFWLYETYSNPSAFDAHVQTDHFKDFNQVVGDWIEDKKIYKLDLLENEA